MLSKHREGATSPAAAIEAAVAEASVVDDAVVDLASVSLSDRPGGPYGLVMVTEII